MNWSPGGRLTRNGCVTVSTSEARASTASRQMNAFTAKLATLATEDLLELIRRMITEEIFNNCFDAAVDEACNRDENLAVTIEAMWA